jgi:hypothetical protein
MRDKDQIILEDAYYKTKKVLNEQNDDIFESEIDLDVYDYDFTHSGSEYTETEYPDKISVKYRIEVEYRSYGIKGIYATFISAPAFTVGVISYPDPNDDSKTEEKLVTVDLSNIEVETEFNVTEYGGVSPETLEVTLDKELKPVSVKLIF